MRTYAYGLFHSHKITLFAPSFLSELENINAVEVSCRETLHWEVKGYLEAKSK